MLKCAVLWGYLNRNPADPVKPPTLPHREMDFLTPAEVRLLLPHSDDWYRPLLATAILTGVRQGELLAIQWGDIDWVSRTLRIQRSVWNGQFQAPKTARSVRNVGMPRTLADALMLHKTRAPANEHDLVFTTPEGQPIDPANLRNRVFEPALRAAGLRHIRFHDLRHTYASLLINQGENIKFVQTQLGHASIQMTVDKYGHLLPDAHVQASDRLDATVFGDTANPDDKMLTNAPEGGQVGEPIAPRPAEMLVGDTGFEPVTFTL